MLEHTREEQERPQRVRDGGSSVAGGDGQLELQP